MQEVLFTSLILSGISGFLSALIYIIDSVVNNYGEVSLDINNGKEILKVQGGSSLLSLLVDKKIFIPSACGGKGSCGACKVQILDAKVPASAIDLSQINQREAEEGIRLSCQFKVKSDIKIVIPDEIFSVKKYDCYVEKLEDLTHDIKRLYMKIKDGTTSFVAGQYMQIVVPKFKWSEVEKAVGSERAKFLKENAIGFNKALGNDKKEGFPNSLLKGEVNNSEPVMRAYSLSSVPSDNSHLELLVRLVPGGVATTYVHTLLKEKDSIEVVGPFGDFYVRDTKATMLCIAGGSGMAPIKSIVYDMLEKKIFDREIWYFFGAKTKKDLYYSKEMRELEVKMPNFHFVEALSEPLPEDNWTGEVGLITDVLDRNIKTNVAKNPNGFEGYLCGSLGMINACVAVLTKNGVEKDKIYYDSFQ